MLAGLAMWTGALLVVQHHPGWTSESRDIDLSLRQVLSKCQERGAEVGRKEMSWLSRAAARPE